MAALFIFISAIHHVVTLTLLTLGLLSAQGMEKGMYRKRCSFWTGFLFLVLALLAGGYSSYIGYADDSLATSVEIVDS